LKALIPTAENFLYCFLSKLFYPSLFEQDESFMNSFFVVFKGFKILLSPLASVLGESFKEKSKLRFNEPVRVSLATLSHSLKKGIELVLVLTK
jgi:hypothetical protein